MRLGISDTNIGDESIGDEFDDDERIVEECTGDDVENNDKSKYISRKKRQSERVIIATPLREVSVNAAKTHKKGKRRECTGDDSNDKSKSTSRKRRRSERLGSSIPLETTN